MEIGVSSEIERAARGKMGSNEEPKRSAIVDQPHSESGKATTDAPEPQWADGLRKLYDSVVEEPLPDSFKDLLSKLDDDPDDGKS